MRKKNGIRFIAAGSMGLLLALGVSTSSIADVAEVLLPL